ncbi:hypothetical protein LTR85_004483 [Meristemomyces frigidus]|nr:hypothetical protein LTR85_004483 [Meristemomyces frigidus]
MRIPQTNLQKIKAGVHFAQAGLVFITACLALAVLTKSGGVGGEVGYLFGLCFLSIPALIYLVMVPMWTRAWRFANVYAYASLDVLFTILWFAAFCAVAAWNSAGIRKGEKEESSNDKKTGSCSAFGYGSASKCEVSKASVGFAVIICLLFGVTSAISIQGVMKYRRTGIMPNGNTKSHGQAEQLNVEDPNKDAWSTNIDEDDEAGHGNPFGDHNNASSLTMPTAYGQVAQQDNDDAAYGLLHTDQQGYRNTSHDETADELPHPGRQMSYGSSAASLHAETLPVYDETLAPSALSPTGGYEQSPGGRVGFPEGRLKMEFDTKTPQYSTSDPNSFASVSARDRWPVILTGAIDDIHKAVSKESDAEKREEGKQITAGLAKLKYEVQHDRQLSPLVDDGSPDIAGYNAELKQRGEPKWFNVPWLFSECYLYRRMATLFSTSQHWKSYDVFSKQKMSTFRSSRPAVIELAARYNDLTKQLRSTDSALANASEEEREQAQQAVFTEMCEICLWGNATDLSLLTNLSYDDIQKLQGSESRKANEKNIVVNDFPAAFATLKQAQKSGAKERRVDIVLDNAGFELFVDLVLAGYLLQSGLATHIVLHPKNIPWFVSDVVPKDFSDLLNVLVQAKSFYETPSEDDEARGVTPQSLSDKEQQDLKLLFENWGGLYAEGKIVLRPNGFWTEGGSYWRLPATAPSLYADLKESELVIFKGDLNYRKLTADAMWDPTTPFAEAIGPMGRGSGVRVLALRTCKADVVVGLSEGEDERLKGMEGGGGEGGARKWAWSGKWAVVSFCDGNA